MSVTLYCIPNDLVFSPCKVDGNFWTNFHVLLSLLGNPEELVRLKNESLDEYNQVIEPFVRFITATEAELHARGHISEVDLDKVGKN